MFSLSISTNNSLLCRQLALENKAHYRSRQCVNVIIEADNVVAEHTWFLLLILTSETIITTWLTIIYWFSTSIKISINHKGYSYLAVAIFEFDYAFLIWHLDPDCLISWDRWIDRICLQHKSLLHLSHCFPFQIFLRPLSTYLLSPFLDCKPYLVIKKRSPFIDFLGTSMIVMIDDKREELEEGTSLREMSESKKHLQQVLLSSTHCCLG